MRCCPGHRSPHFVSATDRFWSKVKGGHVDECWEWQGYIMPNGYGQFRFAKTVLAHRWAYESMRHPIPSGLDIDHLCANRRCVNPWHLEPVTRAINLARQERHQPNTTRKATSS